MKLTLQNGTSVPQVGFGTWPMKKEACFDAVVNAIKSGYRHIDTAYHYQNEDAVGRAIKHCIDANIVTRDELYVTTKLADHHKLPGMVERAINEQLTSLNLDYIDLYLIHSPWSLQPSANCWALDDRTKWSQVDQNDRPIMADIDPCDTWKELEAFVDQDRIKSLGVSNFSENQIDRILAMCRHRPQVNQVECTPLLSQTPLLAYCTSNEILLTAYSPLGSVSATFSGTKTVNANLLEHETVVKVAHKHQRTPAQILLRFQVQRGVIIIPKSADPQRQRDNFDMFSFTLDSDDMQLLDQGNAVRMWTEERVQHSKYFPQW